MAGLYEGSNMNKNIMGYFKSIQAFIRSLFYKHEEQTKQNKCTLQQEKYLKIGANICNIGFKSKHAYEDWQEDIFNHNIYYLNKFNRIRVKTNSSHCHDNKEF